MKLQELTGYKKDTDYQNSTLQQYLVRLQQAHKLEIKNGKFAIVLVPEDKPFVYKLWTKDPAFDYWLDLCKKNQNLYFIPKFIGRIKKIANVFVRRSSADDYIKVAQMEKLTPLPFKYVDAFSYVRRYVARGAPDIMDDLEMNYDESFCKWVKDIKEFLEKHPQTLYIRDIHTRNVMMRGEEFVLVDPYVEEDWFYTNSSRLVNHMDDYRFRDNDDDVQYGDDETYITGRGSRTKPVLVSKELARNNISIWKSQAQLDLYGITAEDWPKNVRIDIELLDTFPIPLPKQMVDVLISKCVERYYRGFRNVLDYQKLLGNVEDPYFYEQYSKLIKLDNVISNPEALLNIFSFLDSINDEQLHKKCTYALLHRFIKDIDTYQKSAEIDLFSEVIFPMIEENNKITIDALVDILPKYIDMNKDIWISAKSLIDHNRDYVSEKIVKIFE